MSNTVTLRYEATVDVPEGKNLDELSEELEQWIVHATDSSVVKTMPGDGAVESWDTFVNDKKEVQLNTTEGTVTLITDQEGGASVRGLPSYKHEPYVQKGDSFYHDAIAGVEAVLLSLAAEGITDKNILEAAVDSAIESLSNNTDDV